MDNETKKQTVSNPLEHVVSRNKVVMTHVTYSEKERLTQLVGSQELAIRLGELGVTFDMIVGNSC